MGNDSKVSETSSMGYRFTGKPPRIDISMYPTEKMLADSPLPPLEGPALTAERLVLLLHYGVDFNIWGGSRRIRYWDALTERVKASTYAGPTLASWWSEASTQIVSAPRDSQERDELAHILSSGNDREVLKVLRSESQVLVLRVRVLSETRKVLRESRSEQL